MWLTLILFSSLPLLCRFELVGIVRRLVLGVTIGIMGNQFSIIPLVMFLVLGASIGVQLSLMPYKSQLVNIIEGILIIVLMVELILVL
jgi:hypothetical protein